MAAPLYLLYVFCLMTNVSWMFCMEADHERMIALQQYGMRLYLQRHRTLCGVHLLFFFL